ncbi:MAG: type II toxin-antitoxin system RelE/ParE family toxin [Candidatus Dormibacteraceae bacterium]
MRAVYYRARDGSEPVREFVRHLKPLKRKVVIENQIARLNILAENDPPLPFPHSSQVKGELRELRCHFGRDLYRIFYRRSQNLFVLLRIIEKRSATLPPEEIEIALKLWQDFVERMAPEPPRQPPRAGGSDAP